MLIGTHRQADLLNRHMSVGFTIPFIMICRSPLPDARTIGLIIACFGKPAKQILQARI